jgi:hypothetical protein
MIGAKENIHTGKPGEVLANPSIGLDVPFNFKAAH